MVDNPAVAALFVLSLEGFDNLKLAALNATIQLNRMVPKKNIAYAKAFEELLIDEDGNPVELEALRDACAFEVNRRVEAGTFS